MAITDPAAVKFSNEKVRVMADILGSAYNTAVALVNEWNATNMSSLITNTSDIIVDGSATDGRHQITGVDATAIITRAQELIADYEASSNAKLNTILKPAVNYQARF